MTATTTTTSTAAESDGYVAGAIIRDSWGYDQTNIDFYRIVKRSGEWVTLERLRSIQHDDGPQAMTGKAEPGERLKGARAFRRKLQRNAHGEVMGFQIDRGVGWARLWDGQPSTYSSYH